MISDRFLSARTAGLIGLIALVGACATFKGEIPVAATADEVAYISPRGADGIQDALVVPVAVSAPYTKMVLGGYRFTVTAADGRVIRVIEEAAVTAGQSVQGNVTGVRIPTALRWDGKDAGGGYTDDGEYTWRVEAWDTKGNVGSSPVYRVVVDNIPPSTGLTLSSDAFSPNGDGQQDTLVIDHPGATTEDVWRAEIRDATGRVLMSYQWPGTPQTVSWPGTDTAGTTAPDGAYVYSVTSRDRAGNSGTVTSSPIAVDTTPAAATLGLSALSFSPNGDGVRDTVLLLPKVVAPDQVRTWTLAVQDNRRTVRRTITGTGRVPDRIEYDGTDDRGVTLSEGVYTAVLQLAQSNGASAQALSPAFQLRVTAPRAALTPDFPVFSPGSGRDSVTIRQETSEEEQWDGAFTDRTGRVVATRSWEGAAPTFSWDGRDDQGVLVPDGAYTYTLRSTDPAGNIGAGTTTLRVDTRPATVTLGAGSGVFSPNGDGVADTIDFDLSANPSDDIDQWRLRVLDSRGIRVADYIGQPGTPLSSRIRWDGKTPAGGVADGELTAELVVQYGRGAVARAERRIDSDLTAPRLSLTATPQLFSPDDDGVNDTLSIRASATDEHGIGTWELRVVDPGGQVFTRWSGTGAPTTPIAWNGRSPSGELVQSAEDYGLALEVRDTVGNRAVAETQVPIDILVLRDGDRLKIVISSIYFKEYTADYRDVPRDRAQDNLRTLDRLAEKLLKFPLYGIRVEGHAVSVYWNDAVRGRTEEQNVLQPLSRARAEAVRAALMERAVPGERMTVAAFGGTQPVVPHGDLQNRWKNRRVEFILERR